MKFSNNGSELWLSCKDSYLIVINANDWHVIKNVAPEEFPITKLQMLSTDLVQSIIHKTVTNFSIGQTNTTDKLAFLTESPKDSTITVESFTPRTCSSIKRFTCSPDSKILALIQNDGTLKLYSMEFLMRQVFQTKFAPQSTDFDQTCSNITENLKAFDKNVSDHAICKCYHCNFRTFLLVMFCFVVFFFMRIGESCLVASTFVSHTT